MKEQKRYICRYNLFLMNIVSVSLLVCFIGILIFLYKINLLDNVIEKLYFLKTNGNKWFDFYFFLLLIGMFIYLIVHEIIHGIFYRIMGAQYINISFGMVLEKGIFYCKCKEDINRKNILVSVIAPFILLGIIPFILGVFLSSFTLLFLSVINISGCGGDLMVFFFFLKREKDCKFREIGDSTTFTILTKEQMLGKKFLSIRVEKEMQEKDLPIEVEKKITISKISKIILVILFLILLLSFLKYVR